MPIPHFQGTHPNLYNKTAMVLSNNNITLLLRHREMTSLQYPDNVRQFSMLALDAIAHVRGFINKGARHLSFQPHMVSSIAGALLVLCALLVRDLSSPALNLQHNYQSYVKGFQEGFAMLDVLKYTSSYARRVLDDFNPLRGVVERVVQEFTPDRQIEEGFDVVEALLPPNIVDLFPFRALTPSLQAHASSAGETLPVGQDAGAWDTVEPSASGGGVLWLY